MSLLDVTISESGIADHEPGVNERSLAVAKVQKLLSAIADWERRRLKATGRQGYLRSSAGATLLDDPGAGEEIRREMRDMADEIDMAERAIKVAHERLEDARLVVLNMDAAKYDAAAVEARGVLEAHNEKTAKLLRPLERHEGEYVPLQELIEAAEARTESSYGIYSGRRPSGPRKSTLLQRDIDRACVRAMIIRDVAAGANPNESLLPWRSDRDGSILGLTDDELYPPEVADPAVAVVLAPRFRHLAED